MKTGNMMSHVALNIKKRKDVKFMNLSLEIQSKDSLCRMEPQDRGQYFRIVTRELRYLGEKQCSMCFEIKKLEMFNKNGVRKNIQNYHKFCIECRKLHSKNINKELKKNFKNYIPKLLRYARRRTRAFKLPECNLTKDYLFNLWNHQEGRCFYTKDFLNIDDYTSDLYCSLDKVDPEKGYVIGNVVYTSKLCNFTKNKRNFEEFYEFCLNVVTNFKNGEYPKIDISTEEHFWLKNNTEKWLINNPLQKLSSDNVRLIKDLISKGEMTLTDIGKLFKVGVSCISAIKHNKSWKNI